MIFFFYFKMPNNLSSNIQYSYKFKPTPEVPYPWEKLVTYTNTGNVFQEFYMNPETNHIAFTVEEVYNISSYESRTKIEDVSRVKSINDIAKLVQEERSP